MTSREFPKEEIFYNHSGSPIACGEPANIICYECISTYARYVYVSILSNNGHLMIFELEVYTDGEQILSHLFLLHVPWCHQSCRRQRKEHLVKRNRIWYVLLLSTMPRGFRDNPSVSVEIMVWNRVDNKPSSASVMTHCRMLLCTPFARCVNDILKHFILILNLPSR